jgi:hypothetical protein
MHFSGVHFNILNLFKVSVGKFFAQDSQTPFRTSNKNYFDRTGYYDQINDVPIQNRLEFYNNIQSGYEDQRICLEQRHIRPLSMIITYDSFGQAHHDTGFKGIYVDRYC